MKIGLDYGGVIDFALDGWAAAITEAKSKGHEFHIVSHAVPGADAEKRAVFAERCGIKNHTFWDLKPGSQEAEICKRKAELCEKLGLEVLIDDDLTRVETVGRYCNRCAAFYIPQNLWQIGLQIVIGLGRD